MPRFKPPTCPGGSYYRAGTQFAGRDGAATEDGTNAQPYGGRGGSNGFGGSAPYLDSVYNGGGGGGWYGNGRCMFQQFCGFGRPYGFTGGVGYGPNL